MSSLQTQTLYHDIVNMIDTKRKPVVVVLEALRLATSEFEDRFTGAADDQPELMFDDEDY